MKRICIFVLISCLACEYGCCKAENTSSCGNPLPNTLQYKKNFMDGTWKTGSLQLMMNLRGFTPRTDPRSEWTKTGSYKYIHTDATGFYYVKKIDGRWWLIDPDGYAQIERAVNSLPGDNVMHNYDLFMGLGFNSAGNFITPEDQTRDTYNRQRDTICSYTRRVPFYQNYRNVRKKYYSTPSKVLDKKADYVFVLDPVFPHVCDSLAKKYIRPYINDRDMVGWFTDNEIPFNESQLQLLVRDLNADDPSRIAALQWAAQHGLTENDCINYTAAVTDDLQKQFAGYLAETYFKAVSEALKKVDPNHLNLGSRLHGRPRNNMYVVCASHKYTDVTSVNFYDRYDPDEQIAKDSWTLDHPCLVGEFYMKDINAQSESQSGAGWYVNSQSERGQWYQHVVLQMIKNKCYVAWHYFRFRDDDNGSNKGIVNLQNQEYRDYTCWMRELNDQVYTLVDYYDGVTRDVPSGDREMVSEGSDRKDNVKEIRDGRLIIKADDSVYAVGGQHVK